MRFQEPRQPMEITVRLNITHDGDERFGIDQLIERNVFQLQLAGHRHHDAVESLFHQGSVGADAQLASQHHVKGMRLGATSFVADLHWRNLPLLARRLLARDGPRALDHVDLHLLARALRALGIDGEHLGRYAVAGRAEGVPSRAVRGIQLPGVADPHPGMRPVALRRTL